LNLHLAETLRAGIIGELRTGLRKALQKKYRVAIIVDDLDRSWDGSSDSDFLITFFLGLLEAGKRVELDFKDRREPSKSTNISLCVFVRADIYDEVADRAPEADKLPSRTIFWDDDETLRRVALSRLAYAAGGETTGEAVLERFFTPSVDGVSPLDYMLASILPRPRDLLFYLRACIQKAVNRRHTVVEEQDIKDALIDYSEFALTSVQVELRESGLVPALESLLGCDETLSESELRDLVDKAIGKADDTLLEKFILSGVFELLQSTETYIQLSDSKKFKKHLLVARKKAVDADRDPVFRIHKAFHGSLLIGE